MAAASSLSVLVLLCLAAVASAQLSATFYSRSCPRALATIKSAVTAAVAQEPRMGASLLRLHFHDCFVQGCDASVLLNDTATFTGEQTANPNVGSIRGFGVVDNIKAQVEAVCPGVVSCADILAVAARDSVVALGGPSWRVLLGRRDSTTASLALANSDLPAPSLDLANLTAAFAKKRLSRTDLVALSGAHTIGLSQCKNFRAHIYNDTNVRDAAQGQLPRGGRRRRRQPDAAGHRNVHRVRQRLLHQPAVPERVAALRPAAVQRRRRHGRTGPHVRVHADEVQQGLHGGHDQDGQHQPAHWEAGPDQARLLQGQLASRYSASSCTYAGPSDPTIQQYVVVICSDHYNKAGLRHFSAACLIMCL